MSLQANFLDSTKGIAKFLKGLVEWLEGSNETQRLGIDLTLTFKTTKKKDC